MSLLDRCLKASGRNYPPGYGFALAFLDDHLNPAWLRQGADAIVARVFANGCDYAIGRKDSDLLDYVNAQAKATSAEGFMIEAAQLILAEAMAGDPEAARVMGLCGHVGYRDALDYRYDFDRLSGTGILVRIADDKTSLRYTGEDALRLVDADQDTLRHEARNVEFT